MSDIELTLIIKRHDLILAEVTVDKDVITVGRSSDCDIVLADPSTSLRAAEFHRREEGLYIVDLGSLAGIRVAGELVEERRLAPGDEVEIGPFVIQVEGDAELAAAGDKTILLIGEDDEAVVPGDKTVLITSRVQFYLKLPGGEIQELSDGIHIIGRDPNCEIQLKSDVVSKRHAELTVTSGFAVLKDLGSTNGTLVNERPITEQVRLSPGDRIVIGEIPLVLESLAGSETGSGITDEAVLAGTDFDPEGSDFSFATELETEEKGAKPSSGARLRKILLFGGVGMLVFLVGLIALGRGAGSRRQPPKSTVDQTEPSNTPKPLNEAELVALGETAMQAGEVWEAVTHWEKALQLGSGSQDLIDRYARLMYRIGLVYEGVGEFEDAVVTWDRLVEAVPDSSHPEVVRARARLLRYQR